MNLRILTKQRYLELSLYFKRVEQCDMWPMVSESVHPSFAGYGVVIKKQELMSDVTDNAVNEKPLLDRIDLYGSQNYTPLVPQGI